MATIRSRHKIPSDVRTEFLSRPCTIPKDHAMHCGCDVTNYRLKRDFGSSVTIV